jgi:hypothetical protein
MYIRSTPIQIEDGTSFFFKHFKNSTMTELTSNTLAKFLALLIKDIRK